MESQPLAHSRDDREDKRPIFDAHDTARDGLRVMIALMPHIQVNRAACKAAAAKGFSTATDLADYLVNKGLPFRDAHHAVGSAVAYAAKKNCDLADLTLAELKKFSAKIEEDVYVRLTLEGSVAARDHIGGTAPQQVRAAIARARKPRA